MGKCAYRMCKHFSLVRDAPVLTLPREMLPPLRAFGAIGARVVICGTASYPSWNPWNTGPRPERHLLAKRARMQGFLATDFLNRFPEAEAQISQWIKEGRVNYREEMHEGLEHAPGSLQRLYKGENTGKFVIRLPAAKTRANE
jgi:NADPH-dependent curcumin reductase CurA